MSILAAMVVPHPPLIIHEVGRGEEKRIQNTIDAYQKAIKINPNFHNAWNGLGYAYAGAGNYKKSYEAYQKAVELAPNIEAYKKNLEAAEKRIHS